MMLRLLLRENMQIVSHLISFESDLAEFSFMKKEQWRQKFCSISNVPSAIHYSVMSHPSASGLLRSLA